MFHALGSVRILRLDPVHSSGRETGRFSGRLRRRSLITEVTRTWPENQGATSLQQRRCQFDHVIHPPDLTRR